MSVGVVVVLLALLLAAVSPASGDLIPVVNSTYTFTFSQSLASLPFCVWTAPSTFRVRSTDSACPSARGTSLQASCARNEFESFQLVLAPTSAASSASVAVSAFSPALGSASSLEIAAASFSAVSPWGQGSYLATDYTDPVANGGTFSLSASRPTVLWFTLYVADAADSPRGSVSASITIDAGSAGSAVLGLSLYVYDFALETTPHFDTFMMSQPTITVYELDQLDTWKKVYLEHRMSSTYPAWPDGFNFGVGWDCDTETLIDADSPPSTTTCIWANGCLVRRYVMGKGGEWNGETYDDWMDRGFSSYCAVSTDSSRPDPFCGVSCDTPRSKNDYSGWMCSDAYEAKWGKYLKALEDYMTSHGLYDDNPAKGYWYTQNEPQNQHDYDISAYLCLQSRIYAPQLKVMLSREARPEIAELPEYGNCGYDIWMAHVWRFTTAYTWLRQANGEISWYYSLDTDNICAYPGVCNTALAPAVSQTGNNGAMNPVALNDGPHYRLIPWVAWANRITGWGYYHDDIFWDTRQPSPTPSRPRVSASLLREGLEDYEYLYIANNRKRPDPYTQVDVDDTVLSAAFALGVWKNHPEKIHELRHQLGLLIEGTRDDFPYTEISPSRPFGDYYIDFGCESDSISFGGVEWMGIGWEQYDITQGYGWNSQYMGVPNTIQTGHPILRCIDSGGGNAVERTICYDDYNHPDEFHFQLQPGTYSVTVGIGWPGSCRGDTEYVSINNVELRNYLCSSDDCCGVRNYTQEVGVWTHANGGDLVMTFGNNLGYTILSYLVIIGVSDEEPEVPGIPEFFYPGGGDGLSGGAVAALVIFLVVIPVCAGGAISGWVLWRKHKQQPVIPEKVTEAFGKLKAKVKS
ncbi:hypothetical protein Pelo_6613 [Pelomyxa schiedti]|nr:hypothetical protein Pelo_6613 [Pelomyxa schiedti]